MTDRPEQPADEAEPPVSSTTGATPGVASAPPPGVGAILTSRAFLIGTGLLLLWGVSLPLADESDLARWYWGLIGVLPGAYVIAGLLAPPRPFVTGLVLGSIQVALLLVHWSNDWPEVSNSFILSTSTRPAPPEILLLIALVTLGLGTLVTGVGERMARRSRAGCLLPLAFIALLLLAMFAVLRHGP